MSVIDSKLIKLLKSETKAVVLYCDESRLYFDDVQWVVRGGKKKPKNLIIYSGNDLGAALLALENGTTTGNS